MKVVKKSVSLKRNLYEGIQDYRANYIAEKREFISFSSALSEMAKEGMKAKGLWKK